MAPRGVLIYIGCFIFSIDFRTYFASGLTLGRHLHSFGFTETAHEQQ